MEITFEKVEKIGGCYYRPIINGQKTYNTIYLSPNTGNCKVNTLNYIGNLVDNTNGPAIIKAFVNSSHFGSKITFLCTLIREQSVKKLQEVFETVYVQKVPIGYYDGFQYHCCFFTDYGTKSTYAKRVREYTPEATTMIVKKTELVNVDVLSKITPEQLTKYRAYKYPGNAKKYLTNIIK